MVKTQILRGDLIGSVRDQETCVRVIANSGSLIFSGADFILEGTPDILALENPNSSSPAFQVHDPNQFNLILNWFYIEYELQVYSTFQKWIINKRHYNELMNCMKTNILIHFKTVLPDLFSSTKKQFYFENRKIQ